MKSPICALMLFSIALTAAAQTRVTPPPKPGAAAAGGPTLQATMQFLQQKLSTLGKVNFVEFVQNTNDGSSKITTLSYEYSNFVADADHCTISNHLRIFINDNQTYDGDSTLSLGSVQDIVVKPYAEDITETLAITGSPNLICSSTSPALTVLLARRQSGPRGEFHFLDATLADRVAKALTHAVELCGGGEKNEPF